MSGRQCDTRQLKRLVGAVAIVVAIVLAAPLSSAVLPATGQEPDHDAGQRAIRATDLLGNDVDAALANIESLANADLGAEGEMPVGFAEEVGLPDGARDVRVSGNVAGYILDASVDEALSDLVANMGRRGWNGVSLGSADGVTFLKPNGRYTWMLATCTQVGPATSVVIRFT